MAISSRNMGTITGGIVADPELRDMKNGKIVSIRLAVPYAGTEKGSDDKRGFFTVKFFADDANPNTKFVLGQIDAGNFKKGTTISVAYRLLNERWEDGDKKGNTVVLIADSIDYAGSPPQSGTRDSATEEEVSIPASF